MVHLILSELIVTSIAIKKKYQELRLGKQPCAAGSSNPVIDRYLKQQTRSFHRVDSLSAVNRFDSFGNANFITQTFAINRRLHGELWISFSHNVW